jgi:hypothetical protein
MCFFIYEKKHVYLLMLLKKMFYLFLISYAQEIYDIFIDHKKKFIQLNIEKKKKKKKGPLN